MNLNLPPQKIRNPFIAEWALHRLRNIREAYTTEASNLEGLFNDLTIWELIKQNKPELLANLFEVISPGRFVNIIHELCRLWPKWSDIVASSSAKAISEAAPNEFLKLADRYIQSFDGIHDLYKLDGILDGLCRIESPAGKMRVERFVQLIGPVIKEEYIFWFYPKIFQLAHKNKLPIRLELFLHIVKLFQEDTDQTDNILFETYSYLTDGLPYLKLIHNLRAKICKQKFIELSILFKEDTPLDEFDEMVSKSGKQILKRVLNYLPPSTEKHADIIEYLTATVDEIGSKNRTIKMNVGCFILGLVISLYARNKFDLTTSPLDELIKIASFDIEYLPCYEQIIERIHEFPQNDIVEALSRGIQKAHNTYGEVHLVNIMGSLKYPEFIEILLNCLSEKHGDFVCEAARDALLKIGTVAENAIIDRWDTLDESQKIYLFSVLELIGGTKTAALLLRIGKGKDQNWEEMWCNTALGVPDLSLIKLLEPELKRKQSYIDDTYLKLCLLLDYNPPNLSEIRDRVTAYKVKVEAKRKAFRGNKIGDIIDDTLSIRLVCKECGKENRYEVKNVFIDPSRKKFEPFIGDDLECLSCGAKEGFSITSMGQLALTAELLKMNMVIKEGLEYDGPLKIFGISILCGKRVTLPEALDYYEKELRKHPEDVNNLLGYGNILIKIGRDEQAKEYYRKCLKFDPCCAEAALSLAHILSGEGQFKEALEIMKESLKYKSKWRLYKWHKRTFKDFERTFFEEYDKIEESIDSSFVILDFSSKLPPKTTIIREYKKVSRNDPCPCGSGKKYKHCCMKK